MGGGETTYPGRDDVLDYLARYEARYGLPVRRPVSVRSVEHAEDGLCGSSPTRATGRPAWWSARRDMAAALHPGLSGPGGLRRCPDPLQRLRNAGTVRRPARPDRGRRQLRRPDPRRGVQSRRDDMGDGEAAGLPAGRCRWPGAVPPGHGPHQGAPGRPRTGDLRRGLGDIVMVPPVVEARDRGVAARRPPLRPLYRDRGRLAGWNGDRGGCRHLVHGLPPGARPCRATRHRRPGRHGRTRRHPVVGNRGSGSSATADGPDRPRRP